MVYTVCGKDKALLPQYQELMIQNAEQNLSLKFEKVHIAGNHFPFLEMPEECVDAVDLVVRRSKSG